MYISDARVKVHNHTACIDSNQCKAQGTDPYKGQKHTAYIDTNEYTSIDTTGTTGIHPTNAQV